ncbi:glycosyltransferase family 2 protein [Methanoculleus sp. YWC-01]|uniref:Glycosyltransferase family 2 protein n=1 Tax=Methanoculleus nereidis TaxID=2735141 RepID=A0ABU3YYE4_9EURY|nr:glycosyltransferase family 2 protein [Methanoculleus sp. YWC-01]MDV4341584.1 glycosyltransferase family 2 protein [Methanoculleus sp. YWC-01]
MPRVAIIILNWNGWADTIECIDSIHQFSNSDYDIILVDNHSSDGSIENIRRYCEGAGEIGPPDNSSIHLFEVPEDEIERHAFDHASYERLEPCCRLILIKNNENYGYARGNNIGIKFALYVLKSEYILILNNDVIITDKEMLGKLTEAVNRNARIGAVSPVLRSTTGEIQRTCTGNIPGFLDFIFVYTFIGQRLFRENRILKRHFNYDYSFEQPKEFGVLGGSCILFRSQTLTDVGLFDENTFLYWEEYIIGRKLAERGWKLLLNPETGAVHKGESCIKNLNLKSWARYWSTKSELYYIENYAALNPVKRSIIRFALLLETTLALCDTVLKGNESKFDRVYELKIISVLLGSSAKDPSESPGELVG